MWLFLRIGAWGFQAAGIGLLICFGVEFNGEMMDNVNPYYEVYDDPYSDANYVLGKKAVPLPKDPAERDVRWPLTDDNTGLEKFSRVLSSFSKLSELYSAFWCFQMLAGLLMILVMMDSMDFQKRLGAVYATIKRCWYDLAVFAFCFLVISLPSAMCFNITVGLYYVKMATLGDAFYYVALSNVAGSQVDIATEVIDILRVQGITGFQALPVYALIYGLPILYGCVIFNFLFAIIGNSYIEVKKEFQESPTLKDDALLLTAYVLGEARGALDKNVSSGRVSALMKAIEHRPRQAWQPKAGVDNSPSKNLVHVAERRLGLEELRKHIGLRLETRFDPDTLRRRAGKPDPKSDPCVADLSQYLSRGNREAADEWALFHNPLLRYHIREMPQDAEGSSKAPDNMGEPSIPALTQQRKRDTPKQRQLNNFGRQVKRLVEKVRGAQKEVVTRQWSSRWSRKWTSRQLRKACERMAKSGSLNGGAGKSETRGGAVQSMLFIPASSEIEEAEVMRNTDAY